MFCELAAIVMISGQPTLQQTPWVGGERTKAEGGLTAENCKQFVDKYNLSHKTQLACVCGK